MFCCLYLHMEYEKHIMTDVKTNRFSYILCDFSTTASNFAHMDGRWRLSSIKRSWRAASDVHKFFEYAGCSPAGGIICLLC